MKWTSGTPTLQTAKHGEFYWFKGTIGEPSGQLITYDSPTLVELHSNGHQLFAKQIYANWWTDVKISSGLWAGPIDPPTE